MTDTLLNLSQSLISFILIFCAASAVWASLRKRLPNENRQDLWLLTWSVTFLIVGYGTFLLGQVGMLKKPIFFGAWLLVVILGIRPLIEECYDAGKALRIYYANTGPVEKFILALLLVRTAIIFMGGTIQIPYGGAESDVLHYHLVLPKLYMQQGSMAPLSWSTPDKYPLMLHMIYLAGFALLGTLFAKAVVFGAYVSSIWLVYRMATRISTPTTSLWMAALFAGVPAIIIQSGTAMIDVIILALCLLATEALWSFRSGGRRISLVTAALAIGLVASSRSFTFAWIPVFALAVFVMTMDEGKSSKRAAQLSVTISLMAFVVYLPWLLRTWFLTGNPLYPLFFRWFGGAGLDAGRAAALENVAVAYGMGKEFLAFVSLPWNLTFRFAAFDYPIGPIYLATLPLVVFLFPWKQWRWLAALIASALALWFLGSQQTRYLYLVLALYFVLLGASLERIVTVDPKSVHILYGLFAINLTLSCFQAERQYAAGFKRLFSGQSNEVYLDTHVRKPNLIRMVSANVPPTARVLLLDAWPEYLYYFPRFFVQGGKAILATNYWDIESQTGSTFLSKLHQHGIEYLVADRGTTGLDTYLSLVHPTLLAQDSEYSLYAMNLNHGKF